MALSKSNEQELNEIIHKWEKAALTGNQRAVVVVVSMFRAIRQWTPEELANLVSTCPLDEIVPNA